jgi:hypothetical protein
MCHWETKFRMGFACKANTIVLHGYFRVQKSGLYGVTLAVCQPVDSPYK